MSTASQNNTNETASGGQSQWMLVWREFRKRKLAVFCMLLIVMLVTSSIFAPFIANGKPIYYFGYNRFQYDDSRRTILTIINSTIKHVQQANSNGKATSGQNDDNSAQQGKPLSPEQKIADTRKTIAFQVAAMSQYLNREKSQQLQNWATQTDQLFNELLTDIAPAEKKLKAQVNLLTREFSSRKVELKSISQWPVLASLTALDYGFITFNIALLLMPIWLWVYQHFIRRAFRFQVSLFTLFGIPIIAGLIGWVLITPTNDRTDYKKGVMSSDLDNAPRSVNVVYQSVLWPLVPYSLDEIDLDNNKTPPEILPAEYWLDDDALKIHRAKQEEQSESSSSKLVSTSHYLGD